MELNHILLLNIFAGWPCWALLLLAGVLPFILGFLLGRLWGGDNSNRIDQLTDERDREHRRANDLEQELAGARYQIAEMDKDISALQNDIRKWESDYLELEGRMETAQREALVFGGGTDRDREYAALFAPSDLQIIEGIGPKVEAVLNENGIEDWSGLASQPVEHLRNIMKANQMAMIVPDSWPKQAALANAGRWNELALLQHQLNAGREQGGDGDNPAKIDSLARTGTTAVREAGMDYGALFPSDQLQIIEGIGPKVEQLLKNEGIADWAALAGTTPEALRTLLRDHKLQMMNPDTWPQQAALAAEGKWEDLATLQHTLAPGKQEGEDPASPAKIQIMAMQLLGFSNDPEDLKIIEGIGPKIEELLKKAGINTWSDLAAADPERLSAILSAAGSRFRLAQPDTWPRQAALAAQGKWETLKAYQDELQGGR